MADGKNIIILFVCVNILAVALSYLCLQGNGLCSQNYSDGLISYLFNLDASQDLSASGGVSVTGQFANATNEALTPQTSGFNVFDGIGLLLDGLKMALGFISLFTPFPFLDFIYSMGVPIIYTILFALPVFIVWAIAIVEFMRGATL